MESEKINYDEKPVINTQREVTVTLAEYRELVEAATELKLIKQAAGTEESR